jgi:hypothetical protein
MKEGQRTPIQARSRERPAQLKRVALAILFDHSGT